MTPRTLKARVKQWQRRYGFAQRSVEVRVVEKLRINGAKAHAGVVVSDQRIEMEFLADLLQKDSDTIDHFICHEFGHVLTADLDVQMTRLFGRTGRVYKDLDEAIESICDAYAAIVINSYKRKRDRH